MAANKVKFGLCNVHYALVTETVTDGVVSTSYGAMKPLPGAVNLSLSNSASKSIFRADNEDYYVSYGAGGFEGDLEVARINEDFFKDVLGVKEDDDGILVEDSDAFKQTTYFALLFEFDGDKRNTKHVLYKCSASRPNIASATTGEGGSTDPQTETITITSGPRADADKLVHAWTQESTDAAVISAWYTAVPVPTFTP